MDFVVSADNGGSHHWTIVAASGESLVQCASFASHEEARQAARIMHASAASASLEQPTGNNPADRSRRPPRHAARATRPRGRALAMAMTHLCCPPCRLRFTRAAAAYITACPECGDSPQPVAILERTLGFRLVGSEDLPYELPNATAVSIALTEPGTART